MSSMLRGQLLIVDGVVMAGLRLECAWNAPVVPTTAEASACTATSVVAHVAYAPADVGPVFLPSSAGLLPLGL